MLEKSMELRDVLVEGNRQIALCHSYFVTTDYVASYLCAVITEIVLLFAPTLFFAQPPFPSFYSYRINVHTFLPKKAIIVVFHVTRSFKSRVCATYVQLSKYHGNPIIVFLRSHHTFEELSGQSSYW